MKINLLLAVITVIVTLPPALTWAMEVQVVDRDKYGNMVLKSGDLTTPSSLSGRTGLSALQALNNQGEVGAIFGSVQFAKVKPIPLVMEPPRASAPLPGQVLTSLQQVPEPSQISYGLSFGGIAVAQGSAPQPTPNPLGPGTGQGKGSFTLDGTIGGPKATALVASAGPKANPLPGTVGLYITGLGAGLGALRLLRRHASRLRD